MQNEAVGIAGIALLLAVSGWCMIGCTTSLISMFRSRRTFDRQLGKVDAYDNPNLFGLHVLGLGFLMVFCAVVQIAIIFALCQRFAPE